LDRSAARRLGRYLVEFRDHREGPELVFGDLQPTRFRGAFS
jgi:hypothetical protein